MDALNMTMHIFCMVLMIALIVSQLLRKMNDLQNRLFLLVLIIMFLTFSAEWGVHFLDAHGYAPGVMHAFRAAVVMLNTVQYPVLFLYLMMDETNIKRPFQKSLHIVLSAAAIGIGSLILFLINPLWNHPVFTKMFADETTGYLFFSKLAILIGLVYLLVRRVISWEIPVVMVGTVALCSWAFGADPLKAVLSGGLLLGACFMATDYVTTPMLKLGHVIYAVGCGLMVALIRQFGNYPEGVTYAILLMNIVTPLLDRALKRKVYGEVKQHG